MAARWNSSRTPERPRSRSRSKPWWVFKCAKRISTRCERGKILPHSARLTLLLGPIEFVWCFAMIAAGVGLQHAGVDGKAFALDQAHRHRRAGGNDNLARRALHRAH